MTSRFSTTSDKPMRRLREFRTTLGLLIEHSSGKGRSWALDVYDTTDNAMKVLAARRRARRTS